MARVQSTAAVGDPGITKSQQSSVEKLVEWGLGYLWFFLGSAWAYPPYLDILSREENIDIQYWLQQLLVSSTLGKFWWKGFEIIWKQGCTRMDHIKQTCPFSLKTNGPTQPGKWAGHSPTCPAKEQWNIETWPSFLSKPLLISYPTTITSKHR